MIKGGQISKGMCLIMKGAPYLVVEREFVNPGKGAAFSRLKLKNLKDGSVLKETVKSNDNVEEADVHEKNAQYMYADGEVLHFMDNDTYDQFEVPVQGMEDKTPYLREGDSYKIVFWEANAIDIILPMKMVFVVTEAPEAIKGDTVTGATKLVTCETGLQVKCPIFIKEGEKIMVNTETGDYVERVNS
ncbi:elongation factor P [Spirochaeta lutea]|uniref:Elongation factor P n=1 Tax=Spirochaeta lutea TaxID=1480694 RepID=A0A098QVE5_9SPIO|nr:elongation factor P [Spirochaeta lutea]KGE71709.1 elongation factor P [Spirochaeta lutea]